MKLKNRNWFWGLFFLCSAALVIVHQMGVLSLGSQVTILMLFFGIVLAAAFIQSLFYINYFGMLLSLALMCIVFSAPLNLERITPWPVLIAAVFGGIGLQILFGGLGWRKRLIQKHHNHGAFNHNVTTETVDGSTAVCNVRLGSGNKYLHSDSLERVELDCRLGAMEVYFDQAKLSEKGAVCYVNCSCGGVSLYIPRSWKVVSSVSVSLGAVENGVNHPESDEPGLTLEGSVSLGAVEVHYI